MANIGNNTVLGSAWAWTPGYNARSRFASHTAGASEEITEFHLYGSGSRAFNVIAFRADTGVHLGTGVVNINGSAGWYSVTGLNIALPAGVEVRISFEEGAGGSATLYRTSSTGGYRQAASAVAPDPWVDDSVYDYDFSFYAVTEDVAAPTAVDDITVTSAGASGIIYQDQPTFDITVTGDVPETVHSWGFRINPTNEEATAISRDGTTFTLGMTAEIQALAEATGVTGTFWFRPADYEAP